MLKFDLLNNAGIQSENQTENQIQEDAFEVAKSKPGKKKSLAKKSKVNEENKKRLKAVEENLLATENKDESKKSINFLPIIFIIILIGILSSSGFYLYKNPSTINTLKIKISQYMPTKSVKDTLPKTSVLPNNTVQKTIDKNVVKVSDEVAALIQKNSLNLALISGLMELVPNDAIISDFYAKNGNLSLICTVNDIVSGENLKFYVYNHKMDMKPELFYIEKTENDQKYLITGLVNLLENNSSISEYVHLNDSELYYSLNAIAQSNGINIKPLTISKRDQQLIRDAHIVLSGSLSQMINFIRKLSIEHLNVAVKSFEFVGLNAHKSFSDLELKIDLIIYPQSL